MKSTTILFVMLIATSGHAQVFRCPDPVSGKLSFSDIPCSGGEQIQRKRTADEIALESERAALARERAALAGERNRLEGERQQYREQSSDSKPQSVQQTSSLATSYECQIAQKNAWGSNREVGQRIADLACLGPEGAARVQAERERSKAAAEAAKAHKKSVRTNCITNAGYVNCVSR